MTTTNNDVAKDFITQSTDYRSTGNFSFHNRAVYSYNTLLGMLSSDEKVLLLADTNMTNTTAKHRGELIGEAIKHDVKILQVPMQINSNEAPTLAQIKGRFEARLDKLAIGTELALADNRREFLLSYENYKLFCEYSNLSIGEKYKTLAKNLEDVNFIKELQRKRRNFQRNANKNYSEVVKQYF